MNFSYRKIAGMLVCLLSFSSAQAAFVFDLVDSGGNLVLSGSGTIDLTGLHPTTSQHFGSSVAYVGATISPYKSEVRMGIYRPFQPVHFYGDISGPASFGIGLGPLGAAISGSGDSFGIVGGSEIYVPQGYVSGTYLSGSTTWFDRTIAHIGATPGTYVWSLPNDTITLNVGVVPIPAAVWLFGSALVGLGWMRRKVTA